MEREEIVREDFSTVRRGWDPAEVRAHLESLVERLPRGDGGLASVAAERVSKIVAAAEETAAQIEADAREQATRILTDARNEAERRIEQAEDAVSGLVSQAEELRSRVGSLGQTLAVDVRDRVQGAEEVPAPAPAEPAAEAPGQTEPAAEAPAGAEVPEPEAEAEPEPEPQAGPEADAPAESAGNGEDPAAAARLVALNLALEGADREQIAAKLEAEFSGRLDDPAALVDEVLARAGRA